MKKIDFKYQFIIFIISGGILFSLLFFSIKYNWNYSFILRDILYFPINVIVPDNEQDIVLEGRELELQKEVNELKELLEINNSLTDFTFVNATVVNRNTAYWNSQITINKGSNSKIKEGMAVIDGNGLVGRVEKVGFNTSVVKLITNNSSNNKISVKIWANGEEINKVLTIDEDNNMIISGIDNSFKLEEGALVTTSGLSDIYPSGIIIGYVDKVENDKFGISKRAYIKHKSNLDNIRFVSVLIRSS